MSLASILVLIFIFCMLVVVPPMGILLIIFYAFWWWRDSTREDDVQTTEVTVTTYIGNYPCHDVVYDDVNGNVGEFQIKTGRWS